MKCAPNQRIKRNQAKQENGDLGPFAGEKSTHSGIPG